MTAIRDKNKYRSVDYIQRWLRITKTYKRQTHNSARITSSTAKCLKNNFKIVQTRGNKDGREY